MKLTLAKRQEDEDEIQPWQVMKTTDTTMNIQEQAKSIPFCT